METTLKQLMETDWLGITDKIKKPFQEQGMDVSITIELPKVAFFDLQHQCTKYSSFAPDSDSITFAGVTYKPYGNRNNKSDATN